MAAKQRGACHQFGLALGLFAGFMHLVWSVVVGLGYGQEWIDYSAKMHMVSVGTEVLPFSMSSAVSVVLMALVCGYIMGYVLGTIWGVVQKKA